MQIQEYVDIREYCTFRVGGQFRYMITIHTVPQLIEAYSFAHEKKLPIKILGGGSNMVFCDGVLESVVLRIEIMGIEILSDTDIKAGAGENWDAFVGKTVEMNLSGLEALSAIPGTVGATPVQNVGAYGQEVKNTIVSVEVFDPESGEIKTLTNAECHFSYRDSIFKQEAKGKYVIISVVFRLNKEVLVVPDYPGVKKYFDERKIAATTILQIREAITEIRRTKLPNPKEIANVGSFFKNPIVENTVAQKIKSSYPDVHIFPVDDTYTKVPAGWLIENAGLKGYDFGKLSTYPHNALVLVNNGMANRVDVESVRDQIIQTVFEKFGVHLETEPEFL